MPNVVEYCMSALFSNERKLVKKLSGSSRVVFTTTYSNRNLRYPVITRLF